MSVFCKWHHAQKYRNTEMKKCNYSLFVFAAIYLIGIFNGKAQTLPGKFFMFSNSLVTDSTMLMASWWNSNVSTVTYEAWIKPVESDLSFDVYRTRTVIFKQHYGTSGIYLENAIDGTSGIKVVIPGIANPWSVTKLPRIKDNEWSYVALVLNGLQNKVTVWVNEQKYDSIFTMPITGINFWAGHLPGGDGNLSEVRPFTIGLQWPYYPTRKSSMTNGRVTVDRFFRGEMDEVRIWSMSRTDDQIQSSQYQPLIGDEQGLLAYYNFETISTNGDSITNVKTGKLDCAIWGKNLKSGLTKSYAMVRPVLKEVTGLTSSGFIVNWDLIQNVDAYYLDVATDILFSNLIDSYKNVKIPVSQTSLQVSTPAPGDYYVRIRLGNNDNSSYSVYSPQILVNVKPAPITSIILNGENGSSSISMDRGILKILTTIMVEGPTDKSVIWSIDNPLLASVNQQGEVTAIANGRVTITAKSVVTPNVSGTFSIDITNQAADLWVAPIVNQPATLYWGGYQNMAQLVDPGASWEFVKQNMDGFIFHGAYWANSSGFPEIATVGPKLGAILKPYHKKNLMELGWPGTYTQFQPTNDMALKKAQGHVQTLNKMKSWGIAVDEINIDWHLYLWKPLCVAHPDWNVKDITAWVTGDYTNYSGPAGVTKPGYFPDYINTIRKDYPVMTFYAVDSPVWFWWDNYPSIGKSENNQRFDPLTGFDPVTGANNTTPVLVNGQPVQFLFNWHDIMVGIINSTGNSGFEGLGSDYPYDYTQWSDPVARESCYQKVLLYEKWFHSVGKKHTLICNTSDGDKLFSTNHDSWDKDYYEKSMAAMINYQKRGGRADRYLFESWYSGPFAVVPETKQYTFTNLVKNAINYLKGIDQKLDLQVKKLSDQNYIGVNVFQTRPYGAQNVLSPAMPSQTYLVNLRNAGDYACYPMLKALKMNASGWDVSFWNESTDITSKVISDAGYTFPGTFDPGVNAEIKIIVTKATTGTPENLAVSVWAFWNPQDPTNNVRDVVSITYDLSVGINDPKSQNDLLGLITYPNPVIDVLNVELNMLARKVDIKIINLTGSTCYQKTFSDESSFIVNTKVLNAHGMFLLQVIADEKKYTRKIFIL